MAIAVPGARVRARRQPGWLETQGRLILGSLSVVSFLVAWELIGLFEAIPVAFIARPTLVVEAGYDLIASGELLANSLVSLQEFVYGFFPAVVGGVGLGIAMGRYRRIGNLLDPLMMAFYTMPRIALLPLLIIWFGVGIGSKVAIVFLGAVFPIIVNTMAGIRQIEPVWVTAARSFGCGELGVLRRVVVPGALPTIMTGIRLGVGRGIISVIVGEMYVSVAGLGRIMMDYSAGTRVAHTIVLVTVVAGFGYLMVRAVYQLEKKLGPWRQAELG